MNRNDATETPEALLDAIGAAPDEPTRDQLLDRLIARFPAPALLAAIRPRLGRLDAPEGEVLLRLVENLDDPGLLDTLAAALKTQRDLLPDRAWLALAVLDGAGRLVDPALREWWEELEEIAGEGGTIDELAAQIEDDPDQLWVALQAMGAIEPEVRAEIVGGLADRGDGPALAEFLRLLSFAHDPATREAALAGLAKFPTTSLPAARAWAEIAADHPDAEVAERARRRLAATAAPHASTELAVRSVPRVLRSVATRINGAGRGTVGLLTEDAGRFAAATFLCDVFTGIADVVGLEGDDPEAAGALLDELAGMDASLVETPPELAVGLLSGALLLCRGDITPALRYWVERTVGRGYRPRPFGGLQGDWDPTDFPFEAVAGASRAILDHCPDWVDQSPLTADLAEAIRLREGDSPPDPRRDAGTYRFLFEHRLRDRLELYRRLLLWMSSVWLATDRLDLGRAALAVAWQLGDPAHAVPGHPFTVELTTRSLGRAASSTGRRG